MKIIIKNVGFWENKAYVEYTSDDGTDMLDEVLYEVTSCNLIDFDISNFRLYKHLEEALIQIWNPGRYKYITEALIDGQYMCLQNGTVAYVSKDRKTLKIVEISRMGKVHGIRLHSFLRYLQEAKFITEDERRSMQEEIRNNT